LIASSRFREGEKLSLSDASSQYVVKEGYYYTKDHEWVKKKAGSDSVLIGITDYAAKLLHDIVYVTLPSKGQSFSKKDVLGQVESVKTVADVYMPVSGTVVTSNETLTSRPELISESPYDQGWMVEATPRDLNSEISELLQPKDYSNYVAELKGTE
jgi:glycine cleavage system H protein